MLEGKVLWPTPRPDIICGTQFHHWFLECTPACGPTAHFWTQGVFKELFEKLILRMSEFVTKQTM